MPVEIRLAQEQVRGHDGLASRQGRNRFVVCIWPYLLHSAIRILKSYVDPLAAGQVPLEGQLLHTRSGPGSGSGPVAEGLVCGRGTPSDSFGSKPSLEQQLA